MTDAQQATTSTDIGLRRSVTLQTIATLAEQHNLPFPLDIGFSSTGRRLNLRLDDNDRAGVHAWAAVLGFPIEPEKAPHRSKTVGDGSPWVAVKAERIDYDKPVWLAWSWVSVWSAVNVPSRRKAKAVGA
ncbi:hypothetical protein [Actinoplanes sp. NPDC051851]|uniref:hypothetical protein n=1 Tax=Actinoplanes sp. NPDC051851 TaxID=3154753 RepID=UPI0034298F9E